MPYFLINDFKSGLDVRKSILTAPAGTLTKLINAAISPGGEIVKRRAFVKVADLKGTFGLAAIGEKVVAFTKNTHPVCPLLTGPAGDHPTDVTLEYHVLPNDSPTSVLSDYEVFDGKLYVSLYDPTPSPPADTKSGSVLPTGVPDGTTYLQTSDNQIYVWRQNAWTSWSPTKVVSAIPGRGYQGTTFKHLADNKIYVINFNGDWDIWKPRDKGAGVPTGDTGATIVSTADGATNTPVGKGVPTYFQNGDTFLDTRSSSVYVVKGKVWATWDADSNGANLPSSQMEKYTITNSADNKNYVTKNQVWVPFVPDFTVAKLPDGVKDGTAFLLTTDNNYYEWQTSAWVLWTGRAPIAKTSGTTLPTTATDGDIFLRTTDNTTWVRKAGLWEQWKLSARLKNPHYYKDERDTVNDQLLQNLDLTWTWTTKKNPNKGNYAETEGSGKGLHLRAYKSKMYCVGDKYLRFSATDNAFLWEAATDPNDTSRAGANYINISLQEGASSRLTGCEIYYDKLVLMSEYTSQIWTVVSDYKQNVLGQILRATGTRAPWSVQGFGSGDVLFLASSGIRSLKARNVSNSAAVSDIGSPIDEYIRGIPEKYGSVNHYYNARAILEPVVGRFWLAFPREIAVLSYFPGPDVTAWSIYTTDFDIDNIVVAGDRVFIRSGDDLYLFGGVNGTDYDNCGVEVRLPFHDGSKPGHEKVFTAFDATAEGSWDVSAAFNYDMPDAEEPVAHISPSNAANPVSTSTWNKGLHEMTAYSTHLSLRFYNKTAAPAKLSSVAIHYNLAQDSD
jgi:hypothetical protein